MKWQDDSAMKSKFQHAYTTFNDMLIGGRAQTEAGASGIHISDGKSARLGGTIATLNDVFDNMWGIPGVGIFATLQTSGNVIKMYKSSTGFDDFVDVTPAGGLQSNGVDPLGHSLVDLGVHDISGTDKRILLYLEYTAGTGPEDPRIWISAEAVDAEAGNALTWTVLLTASEDAIAHFHGAVYVKGKGLYIMTGDTDIESSILFAAEADIPTLISATSTWITRWGLGADATADGRSGVGSQLWTADKKTAYILGAVGQRWRSVEFVTCDARNAYYIPDAAPTASLNTLYKIDLFDTTDSDAGTVTALKENEINNVGWFGGCSKSGIVYLTTAPYWGTTDWDVGSNGFFEIWAIDPEDDTVTMVKQIARTDYDPSRGIQPSNGSWGGIQVPLVEYGGAMFGILTEDSFNDPDMGTPYLPQATICGRVDKQKKEVTNVLTNGSFESGDLTGWTFAFVGNILVTNDGSGSGDVPNVGDVVSGAGGATALVSSIGPTVSGSWAGGDWAGEIRLTDSVSGIFVPGETVTITGVGSSTITANGITTMEVIPDPTGQIGGNVCRVVQKTTGISPLVSISATLPASVQTFLEGDYVNFSCKAFFKSDGDIATSDGIDFRIGASPTPGSQVLARRDLVTPPVWDTWHDLNIGTVSGNETTSPTYSFQPDGGQTNSGNYVLMYLTGFELIKGALANDEIEQLQPTTTGGGYRGRYSGRGR